MTNLGFKPIERFNIEVHLSLAYAVVEEIKERVVT